MRLRTVWMLLLGLLVVTSSVAWARKWTAAKGGYSVEAELVEVKDGKLLLKRTDGNVITVPLEILSEADRQYVASLEKETPPAETPPAETQDPAVPTSRAGRAGKMIHEPTPPAGQTYIGVDRCAPCHFERMMQWEEDKHSKTFEILTEKYQKDPQCLDCHATGYGMPTGFKDLKSTPDLANNGCENCHGPGSKHEEIAKPFAKIEVLTPAQEKQVRDSIWLLYPGAVCVTCHTQKAHEPSQTPEELKTK